MTRTSLNSKLVAYSALCLLPVGVAAHHGAAAHFDPSIEVKIEGILTDFQLVNPHGYVYFDGLGQVVSSEQLSVRERITHDPINDQLVVEYWAEDPLYWEEPISGVYRLSRTEIPYQAYNCIELGGENNRRDDGTTIFN